MTSGPPTPKETPESTNGSEKGKRHSEDVADDDGSADRSVKRRAHRKSRFGCKNCKTRRIKCDERKPECTNCRNRQVRCDYITVITPSSSNAEPIASPQQTSRVPGALNVADVELMYYWTTSTILTLSMQSAGKTFWQTNVTEMGFAHQHVLRLILAITALHLAHCRPARHDEYIAQADEHYAQALPVVTSELTYINQNNCDAVLLSVELICFIAWARGPQPGEFLAFGENGRSEWLLMFRGIRTTLESLGYDSFTKSHAPNIRSKGKPLSLSSTPPEYEKSLADLRDYIHYAGSPELLKSNLYALDILSNCYNNRYGGIDGEYHVVFAWLFKANEDFLEALQRHDAVPLVLYAHFVVLMNDLECFWYMKGWTAHVMGGIWSILRDEDRVHIRWPMAAVGWIPP